MADASGSRSGSREALLAEARRVLAEDGLHELTYRRLAAAAGCSVGTAFNVLGSRDELVFRLNAETMDEIASTARLSLDAAPASPEERMVALALNYVRFVCTHEQRWRALNQFRAETGATPPAAYVESVGRLFAIIEEAVSGVEGVERLGGRSEVARSLWAAIHGVAVVAMGGGPIPRHSIETSVESLTRILAAGLGTRARGG